MISKRIEVSPKDGLIAGLDEVYKDISDLGEACSDYYVTPNEIRLSMGDDRLSLNLELPAQGKRYVMSSYSIAQWITLAQIRFTIRYVYQLFLAGRGDLLLENLKAFPLSSEKNYLVRTHENTVRAVLSQNYATVDNLAFLDTFSSLAKDGMFVVKAYEYDEHFMRVYVAEAKSFYRDFMFGLLLSNSETGKSSLSIKFFITNGRSNLVFSTYGDLADFFVRRHTGDTGGLESDLQYFVNNLSTVADRIQEKLEQNVVVSVQEEVIKMSNALKLSQKREAMLLRKLTKQKCDLLDFAMEASECVSDIPTLKLEVETYLGTLVLKDKK